MSTKVAHCVYNSISHICAKFQGPSQFRGADIPHGGRRIDMVTSQLCLL